MSADQRSSFEDAFVGAEDGCRIYLRTLKAGHGTPVLFVHALAMDGSLWADSAARLRTKLPLYAMDCRGHGQSDKPTGPYSTAQFANDILAVLTRLDAPAVHLAGCSMGGTVALAFAGHYPDRVSSLTIIDATACYGDDVEAEWETRGMRPQVQGFGSMLEFQLSRWFSDGFIRSGSDRIAKARDIFLRNDPSAYLESCRMLGKADERRALPSYCGPALVLVGSDDYATPVAMATEMAALMPAGRLKVLEGFRHFTPIEAPGLIAQEIDAFIMNAELANNADRLHP